MRDFDIRQALKETLRVEHADTEGTLIVDELGLCQGLVRVDLAVINGSFHGYEIKSERDTLERLPHQRDAYGDIFDAVTIVLCEKHLKAALNLIPCWWGITLAYASAGAVAFREERSANNNPSIKSDAIVQLLWREETMACLVNLGIGRGLRSKPRRDLWHLLVSSISPTDLREIVRETIKARGDWRFEKRQARCNDSYTTDATAERRQANLEWLLSLECHDRLD